MKDIKYKLARIVVKIFGTSTDKHDLKDYEQHIVDAQVHLNLEQRYMINKCPKYISNNNLYGEEQNICDKCATRKHCDLHANYINANDNLQAQINNTRSFVFWSCKEYFKIR